MSIFSSFIRKSPSLDSSSMFWAQFVGNYARNFEANGMQSVLYINSCSFQMKHFDHWFWIESLHCQTMVLAIWNYKVKVLKVHLKMLNYKTFKFQAFVLVNVLFLKPNYFKKQHSLSSFLFTYSNNRGPNWPQVLSRLVPCIQDMELACWILHWHFGVVFFPYLRW